MCPSAVSGAWASLHGFTACDLAIPADDKLTRYHFGEGGRHLKLTSTLTGVVIYQFSYDGQGHVVSLTDGDGNVTSVERM